MIFQRPCPPCWGSSAKGLSAGTISRLKQCWVKEYDDWRTRDLSKESYVYIWADGIYFNVRSDDTRQYILVIIGVTESSDKKFLAIEDGYRESEQREVLLNLNDRGLKSPRLAVGDGALGFLEGIGGKSLAKPVANVVGFTRP